MTSLNYYQILGVSRDATQEEIKKAFRLHASKFHPDKHKGDDFFSSQFKLVKEAYDTLSDFEKRKKYDKEFFGEHKSQGLHGDKSKRNPDQNKSDPEASNPESTGHKKQKSGVTDSDNTWKPNWKYYLGLAIVVLLFFELFFPKATDFTIGWSEEETASFLQSCRGSASSFKDEHGFDDYEVNFYCVCTQREIVSLFPQAQPTLQELNRHTVENISSKCFNEAISTRN